MRTTTQAPAIVPFTAATLLSDPKLKALADQMVRGGELALQKALAHDADPRRYPLPAGGRSIEQAMHAYISRAPAARRRAAGEQAIRGIEAGPEARRRTLGALAGIDLRSARSIASQLAEAAPPAQLRLTADDLERAGRRLLPTAAAGRAEAGFARMDLCATRITCVEKTRVFGELDFKDEIVLRGVKVDGVAGVDAGRRLDTGKFGRGDVRNLAAGTRLGSWNLRDRDFPLACNAALFLTEVDEGFSASADLTVANFFNFLGGFLLVVAGAGAVAPTGISQGAAAGLVIAGLVCFGIGAIAKQAEQVAADEAFAPLTLGMMLASPAALFANGAATSAPQTLTFRRPEGKGRYEVTCRWQLV